MTDDHAGLHLRSKIDGALGVAEPLVELLRPTREGWNRFGAACTTPVGNGQKLCVDPTLMTPSSTARQIQGRVLSGYRD